MSYIPNILKGCCFSFQQSRDHSLDMDPSNTAGPRNLHSSLTGISHTQYPTLTMGASASNSVWPQYPMLARSTSAGGQSDSVFLDAPTDGHSLAPASPGRYSKDPTFPNGSKDDLETDGCNGFPHPYLHHSLPRRSHAIQNHPLPGESVVFIKKEMSVTPVVF